jgi:hypothetical protein
VLKVNIIKLGWYTSFCYLLLLAAQTCLAESPSKIQEAAIRLNQHSDLIVDVLFLNDVDDVNSLANLSNFLLLDIASGQFVPIVGFAPTTNPNSVQLLLDPTIRITKDSKLHLFVKALKLKGDQKAQIADSSVTVRLTVSQNNPSQEVQSRTSEHLLTAGKGKDDSDIYLSGQANGATGQKFTYTADVKLSLPFKKVVFSRVNVFAPVFTYNASTDPKANPDTLGLGLDWSFFPVRDLGSSPFTRLQLTNSPKLEGTHDLDAFNFIHGVRGTFLSRVVKMGAATFYSLPYIGQELGVSISSPLNSTEGSLIARPMAGADLNLVFDLNKAYLKNVALEANGGRRWLLRNEVGVDTDKSGKTIAVNSNTKPKDYIKNSITFGITEYWGITFSHEYGQLPPLYKLAKNKMTVGLTYKAVLNRKVLLK